MQAIGAGGMISVSMAMVKDSFSDKDRPEIIAFLQMLGAFAPTVAPLIGAQIIKHYSWHLTFELLAVIALFSFTISLFVTETLKKEDRLKGNVFFSVLSLKDILVNKPFMVYLLSMSGTSLIYMSFLAVSSYIYINWFKLSETEYSLFFAVNSLILLIGPNAYLFVRNKLKPKQIVNVSFVIIVVAGILILTIGKSSPYLFLISFAPITFANGFLRSFSSNVLLGQKEMNSGGVASVISFSGTALGAVGMMLGTLSWSNYIQGLGWITLIAMVFSLGLWLFYQKNNYKLNGM